LTPEEGVEAITEAGGIPVLAHPIYLRKEGREMDALLERLKSAGLKGIETYYSDNTPRQTKATLKHAERNGLAVTGGSDFHGEFRPEVELGSGRNGNLAIPYSILEKLRELSP
jgi:predicted metal-dependent phosphoesterase TrpH